MAAMNGAELPDALRRMAERIRGGRRRIPAVQQLEWTECGAACLAMVLGFHGRDISLDRLRGEVGARDGADARGLLELGERFGLRGRGVRIEAEDVRHLERGAVLHWDFRHFVVFDRCHGTGVDIVDPATGRRTVSWERFQRSFTGVALVFEPNDTFAVSTKGRSNVFAYLHRMVSDRTLVARILGTSLMLRLLALAVPLATSTVVDRVLPRADVGLVPVLVAGVVGLLLFQFTTALLRSHLLLQLRTNLDVRVSVGFLDHLARLPYAFFQRRSAGDLMMRVASNSTIREILTSSTLSAVLDGVLVFCYLALIFVFHAVLGWVTLGLGLLHVAAFLLSRRKIERLAKQDVEARAQAQNHLTQMLAGIETLKTGGLELRSVARWSGLFVDELNVALERGRVQALLDAGVGLLEVGSPLVLLGAGAGAVLAGELSLGQMLGLTALGAGFLMPLRNLVRSGTDMLQMGSFIERLDDVLDTEVEYDPRQCGPVPSLSGQLRIRNLSFRYGPRSPLALRDVNLDIEPGTSVAIVGPSGSGKSTLAKVLLGLYTPSEGTVEYDGHDMESLDRRALRRQIGAVPQAPFIFGRSIRDNVSMGDVDMPLERIVRACRRAVLHDDVVSMPMAYDTLVADGGASLSGGQRQRLALARALVQEPRILVLDEATSALDVRTEQRVMRGLEELDSVRIIVAHRLSTIAFADRIVVMDRGQVVETGTHATLMAQDGLYRRLVATQEGEA